jgi:YD repeat-containing protein
LSYGTHNYVYDDEDRIVSASLYLGGTASYSYDAEGQRVRKAAGTAVEEYVYDSAGHQFGTMQPSGAMERIELYAGARRFLCYRSRQASGWSRKVLKSSSRADHIFQAFTDSLRTRKSTLWFWPRYLSAGR